MAYCKVKLGLTNNITEEIYTIASDSVNFDKRIIKEAGNFVQKHAA